MNHNQKSWSFDYKSDSAKNHIQYACAQNNNLYSYNNHGLWR